jgi:pyroglutamyl-peptidase
MMEQTLKILVTGFTRFGELAFNPTELMMGEITRFTQSFYDCEVVTDVLPTEYQASGRRMGELLKTFKPDAILGFGVSPSSSEFLLERFAINVDDSRAPDNAGWTPAGLPIVRNGPAAYLSTLPLEQILRDLQQAGIPASYSNHAGTYVCNHVFYLACHQTATVQRARACGFIHVPLTLGLPGLKPGYRSSPVNVITGVQICIVAVKNYLGSKVDTLSQEHRVIN